jgi:hypothetical protein
MSDADKLRMPNSRWVKWAGYVTRMGEGRGVYRVLVGRTEGKRPLGVGEKITLRWALGREIGIDGANWIQLAQYIVWWRVFVNTVMSLRVP